ncbi:MULTISPECIES: hypothetical protein [unclassified Nonomuraea]|uniref:hypothetical protein n=1 Tax=unclassified Nonomuraea TaxID=2593643 RepID=UPI0033E5079F
MTPPLKAYWAMYDAMTPEEQREHDKATRKGIKLAYKLAKHYANVDTPDPDDKDDD